MGYHTMKRRELQALCKKHNLPANGTNLQMADSLTALLTANEKSGTSLPSCLKDSGETAGEGVANRRVRFSLEEDKIETVNSVADEDSERNSEEKKLSGKRKRASKGTKIWQESDPKAHKTGVEVEPQGLGEILDEIQKISVRTRRSSMGMALEPIPVLKKKKGKKSGNNEVEVENFQEDKLPPVVDEENKQKGKEEASREVFAVEDADAKLVSRKKRGKKTGNRKENEMNVQLHEEQQGLGKAAAVEKEKPVTRSLRSHQVSLVEDKLPAVLQIGDGNSKDVMVMPPEDIILRKTRRGVRQAVKKDETGEVTKDCLGGISLKEENGKTRSTNQRVLRNRSKESSTNEGMQPGDDVSDVCREEIMTGSRKEHQQESDKVEKIEEAPRRTRRIASKKEVFVQDIEERDTENREIVDRGNKPSKRSKGYASEKEAFVGERITGTEIVDETVMESKLGKEEVSKIDEAPRRTRRIVSKKEAFVPDSEEKETRNHEIITQKSRTSKQSKGHASGKEPSVGENETGTEIVDKIGMNNKREKDEVSKTEDKVKKSMRISSKKEISVLESEEREAINRQLVSHKNRTSKRSRGHASGNETSVGEGEIRSKTVKETGMENKHKKEEFSKIDEAPRRNRRILLKKVVSVSDSEENQTKGREIADRKNSISKRSRAHTSVNEASVKETELRTAIAYETGMENRQEKDEVDRIEERPKRNRRITSKRGVYFPENEEREIENNEMVGENKSEKKTGELGVENEVSVQNETRMGIGAVQRNRVTRLKRSKVSVPNNHRRSRKISKEVSDGCKEDAEVAAMQKDETMWTGTVSEEDDLKVSEIRESGEDPTTITLSEFALVEKKIEGGEVAEEAEEISSKVTDDVSKIAEHVPDNLYLADVVETAESFQVIEPKGEAITLTKVAEVEKKIDTTFPGEGVEEAEEISSKVTDDVSKITEHVPDNLYLADVVESADSFQVIEPKEESIAVRKVAEVEGKIDTTFLGEVAEEAEEISSKITDDVSKITEHVPDNLYLVDVVETAKSFQVIEPKEEAITLTRVAEVEEKIDTTFPGELAEAEEISSKVTEEVSRVTEHVPDMLEYPDAKEIVETFEVLKLKEEATCITEVAAVERKISETVSGELEEAEEVGELVEAIEIAVVRHDDDLSSQIAGPSPAETDAQGTPFSITIVDVMGEHRPDEGHFLCQQSKSRDEPKEKNNSYDGENTRILEDKEQLEAIQSQSLMDQNYSGFYAEAMQFHSVETGDTSRDGWVLNFSDGGSEDENEILFEVEDKPVVSEVERVLQEQNNVETVKSNMPDVKPSQPEEAGDNKDDWILLEVKDKPASYSVERVPEEENAVEAMKTKMVEAKLYQSGEEKIGDCWDGLVLGFTNRGSNYGNEILDEVENKPLASEDARVLKEENVYPVVDKTALLKFDCSTLSPKTLKNSEFAVDHEMDSEVKGVNATVQDGSEFEYPESKGDISIPQVASIVATVTDETITDEAVAEGFECEAADVGLSNPVAGPSPAETPVAQEKHNSCKRNSSLEDKEPLEVIQSQLSMDQNGTGLYAEAKLYLPEEETGYVGRNDCVLSFSDGGSDAGNGILVDIEDKPVACEVERVPEEDNVIDTMKTNVSDARPYQSDLETGYAGRDDWAFAFSRGSSAGNEILVQMEDKKAPGLGEEDFMNTMKNDVSEAKPYQSEEEETEDSRDNLVLSFNDRGSNDGNNIQDDVDDKPVATEVVRIQEDKNASPVAEKTAFSIVENLGIIGLERDDLQTGVEEEGSVTVLGPESENPYTEVEEAISEEIEQEGLEATKVKEATTTVPDAVEEDPEIYETVQERLESENEATEEIGSWDAAKEINESIPESNLIQEVAEVRGDGNMEGKEYEEEAKGYAGIQMLFQTPNCGDLPDDQSNPVFNNVKEVVAEERENKETILEKHESKDSNIKNDGNDEIDSPEETREITGRSVPEFNYVEVADESNCVQEVAVVTDDGNVQGSEYEEEAEGYAGIQLLFQTPNVRDLPGNQGNPFFNKVKEVVAEESENNESEDSNIKDEGNDEIGSPEETKEITGGSVLESNYVEVADESNRVQEVAEVRDDGNMQGNEYKEEDKGYAGIQMLFQTPNSRALPDDLGKPIFNKGEEVEAEERENKETISEKLEHEDSSIEDEGHAKIGLLEETVEVISSSVPESKYVEFDEVRDDGTMQGSEYEEADEGYSGIQMLFQTPNSSALLEDHGELSFKEVKEIEAEVREIRETISEKIEHEDCNIECEGCDEIDSPEETMKVTCSSVPESKRVEVDEVRDDGIMQGSEYEEADEGYAGIQMLFQTPNSRPLLDNCGELSFNKAKEVVAEGRENRETISIKIESENSNRKDEEIGSPKVMREIASSSVPESNYVEVENKSEYVEAGDKEAGIQLLFQHPVHQGLMLLNQEDETLMHNAASKLEDSRHIAEEAVSGTKEITWAVFGELNSEICVATISDLEDEDTKEVAKTVLEFVENEREITLTISEVTEEMRQMGEPVEGEVTAPEEATEITGSVLHSSCAEEVAEVIEAGIIRDSEYEEEDEDDQASDLDDTRQIAEEAVAVSCDACAEPSKMKEILLSVFEGFDSQNNIVTVQEGLEFENTIVVQEQDVAVKVLNVVENERDIDGKVSEVNGETRQIVESDTEAHETSGDTLAGTNEEDDILCALRELFAESDIDNEMLPAGNGGIEDQMEKICALLKRVGISLPEPGNSSDGAISSRRESIRILKSLKTPLKMKENKNITHSTPYKYSLQQSLKKQRLVIEETMKENTTPDLQAKSSYRKLEKSGNLRRRALENLSVSNKNNRNTNTSEEERIRFFFNRG